MICIQEVTEEYLNSGTDERRWDTEIKYYRAF